MAKGQALIDEITAQYLKKDVPDFRPGDTVKVNRSCIWRFLYKRRSGYKNKRIINSYNSCNNRKHNNS